MLSREQRNHILESRSGFRVGMGGRGQDQRPGGRSEPAGSPRRPAGGGTAAQIIYEAGDDSRALWKEDAGGPTCLGAQGARGGLDRPGER